MSTLLSPLHLRSLTLKNRVVMSPMCQYSAQHGLPNAWHTTHYGSRAQGGAGLIMLESTAISPQGRISQSCLGLWNEEQTKAHASLVEHIHNLGSAAGVQLNHAGRKGSHAVPWQGNAPISIENGGWIREAPSAIGTHQETCPIKELSLQDIQTVIANFKQAAINAITAGFDVIELHAAHGYLLHQFLSPLVNQRTDHYGGDLTNRTRLLTEIVETVRSVMPSGMPLLVRLSCVDSKEKAEGWTLDESVALATRLQKLGVDLLDCTSGGISAPPAQRIGAFNADLAQTIRTATGIPTGTVGGIDSAQIAESVLTNDTCDLVFVGRALLRNPYWLLHETAHQNSRIIPSQYLRAGF